MSKSEPTVAVMIPVYNGEGTLPLAIRSLQAQSYSNWIAVVVNDGSSDTTREYMDQLKDERIIQVHFEENKGRPFARNAALDICKNYKYIAFLDADDFYHPEKLRLQIEYLESHDQLSLVSCGMGSFSESSGLLSVRGVHQHIVNKYIYRKELHAARAASVIRTAKLNDLKFNTSLGMAQDSDFFMRYTHGRSYAVIGRVLYYYSEYDSVTKQKIWYSHSYNLIRFSMSVPDFPFQSMIQLIKSAAKLLLYTLRMPFLSIDQILKGRGAEPSRNQRNDYERLRKQLRP